MAWVASLACGHQQRVEADENGEIPGWVVGGGMKLVCEADQARQAVLVLWPLTDARIVTVTGPGEVSGREPGSERVPRA